MRIIFVRHGLSEANINKYYSLDDTILDESGFGVLDNTRENLKKYNIDRVYTSDLYRAQQTAELLGFDEYTKDARLNELNFGDFKGRLFADIEKEYVSFFDDIKADYFGHPYPAGESRRDLIARTSEFLDELVEKDEDVLCVSHGLAIKSCLFWILKDINDWDSFWIENGSITVFKIENGKKLIESVNLL